ncbi:MAG: hypothetical protein LT071_03005 [Nocardioides sp.]|nr:hypothetical protein [Nocardioides sp.]
MTGKEVHLRGDVLRTVIRTVDRRRDGRLPMDVEGVSETFRDELTLIAALQLKWFTRLTGQIEQQLASEPLDLEEAVIAAWQATAGALPGVRAVLDRHVTEPSTPEMGAVLAKAVTRERHMLALMAGRASAPGEAAARVGADIEARARASYEAPAPRPSRHAGPRLVRRLKAVLAA